MIRLLREYFELFGCPITVRVNRAFFPLDMISICSRGDRIVSGVEVEQIFTNEVLKARGGGGGPESKLTPGSGVDVFVRDETMRDTGFPPLERAQVMIIPQNSSGLLWIKWKQIDGRDEPGQACIAWSAEERLAGRLPLVAIGEAASKLVKYSRDRTASVPAIVLGIRSRAKEMTRHDIRKRIRWERRRMNRASVLRRVESISVEGFRGFREESRLRLAKPDGTPGSGLTFVVGANNSGKSTIWESFDAIARKKRWDVSFSEGRRNRGSSTGVRVALNFSDGGSYLVRSRNSNTSETVDEWTSFEPDEFPEIVAVPSRRQFRATFGRGGNADRDWMSSSSDFVRFRQTDEFTGRLFDIHNDEQKKEQFDGLMEEVLGYQLEWTIDLTDAQDGQSFYLKVATGSGVSHTSEGLGDGIISLLYILNALYDSEPETLIIFDEPELSLHPQLVKRLGEVLARYAKERQIVVFTHSPQIVAWDSIENGAEIARTYKRGPDSRIAQVSRERVQQISGIRRDWRNPHVFGVDANDILFLDDGIILVEGQEDAVLLPRLYEMLGINMAGSIFGWGAGGAKKIAHIVGLLDDLGFTRVAVVVDSGVEKVVASIENDFPGYSVSELPADDIRDKVYTPKKVDGIFDEGAKRIKEVLRKPVAEVLRSVNEYLATGYDQTGSNESHKSAEPGK